MRDGHGRVLYAGKAKDLRARLRAYVSGSDSRPMVAVLMRRAASVEFLVTMNEKEALLLENSLIKTHKPRYNVLLRDDKTHVSIKVDTAHPYPRPVVTRKCPRHPGVRYFGPYASAVAVRETLRQLQRMAPLRLCSDQVLRNRTRPCIYHEMKLCVAPCAGRITEGHYAALVAQAILFLEGRSEDLERALTAQIARHAAALEFEQAAVLRDRLFAVRETLERQRTVSVTGGTDCDVFGLHAEGRFCEVQVLFFRAGRMLGGRSFSLDLREAALDEAFGPLLLQYYMTAPMIPPEVLVPFPLDEAPALGEVLGELRAGRVMVRSPQRGEGRRLVELATRNAQAAFAEKRVADKVRADLLEQVRQVLHLQRTPRRIACFDISSTQGALPVGAMVVFEDGIPEKARYRRFAVRGVEGQDDFAMLREVVVRQFRRESGEGNLPDLLLIDGGRGQLNVVRAALADLGLADLDVVGIAKARPGVGPDRYFLAGRRNPVIVPEHAAVARLLARVRDEAHRFAVTYHRTRRARAVDTTSLRAIPGVGVARARRLLLAFGSVDAVRAAPLDAIAAVPGVPARVAEVVKAYLVGGAGPR